MEIPLIANKPLGPIHSLVHDSRGNIFLSDELNHRVLCLTDRGELLWWHGADSSDKTRFRYPRGLALGRIRTADSGPIDCLGVCDSWNNRIVFLNLEGNPIAEWRKAGDQCLREVSDIRYTTRGGLDTCWLLLDRCNHRLCWMVEEGQLLAQVGEPCIPFIEENFRRAFPENPDAARLPADSKASPAANCLYYPTRLIGGPANAIAVYEPLRRSLKLIRDRQLVPQSLVCNRHVWLAFGYSGWLGWDDSASALAIIGVDGCERLRIPVEGVPVCADMEKNECWYQQSQKIVRINLAAA